MKGKFFLVIVLCICTSSYAQVNKGMWTIGGSFRYRTTTEGSAKTESYFTNPSLGYVLKKNSIIGISFGYGKSNQTSSTSNIVSTSREIYGSFFYRKYFPVSNRFFAFGNVALTAGSLSAYSSLNGGMISEQVSDVYSLQLTPGIAFALSRRFHVEATLGNFIGVNYINGANSTVGEADLFELDLNLNPTSSLFLGVRVFLGK